MEQQELQKYVNKNCSVCRGTGIVYVPNGDADVEADICDCILKQ